MGEELRFPAGIRELSLGESFSVNDDTFCTIKYDFKPETEALKTAKIEISDSDQVTVTHAGANKETSSEVQYKGCLRPYEKECVLIIDHKTGNICLERLSSNIQLKRARMVNNKHHKPKHSKEEPVLSLPELKELTHLQDVDFQGNMEAFSELHQSTQGATSISGVSTMSDSSSESSDDEDSSSSDAELAAACAPGSSSISPVNSELANKSRYTFTNGIPTGIVSPFLKAQILDNDLKLSETESDSD